MRDLTEPAARMNGPVLCFGGPYSNLQATQALLEQANRLGIPASNVVCTGDVVAYCADPAATLDLVIDSGILVVAGNCEENLAVEREDCGCGFAAGTACDLLSRAWYAHAARSVKPRHRAWMGALPKRLVIEIGGRRIAVLHGGVWSISRFLFASAADATLAAEIAATECDGVVAGHCGLPFTRLVAGALWHNPGAIGMPANDGTRRGWFSLLTPVDDGIEIEHHPLEYDHAGAIRAMQRAWLPLGYKEALATGLWPSCDVLPTAELARSGLPVTLERCRWPA